MSSPPEPSRLAALRPDRPGVRRGSRRATDRAGPFATEQALCENSASAAQRSPGPRASQAGGLLTSRRGVGTNGTAAGMPDRVGSGASGDPLHGMLKSKPRIVSRSRPAAPAQSAILRALGPGTAMFRLTRVHDLDGHAAVRGEVMAARALAARLPRSAGGSRCTSSCGNASACGWHAACTRCAWRGRWRTSRGCSASASPIPSCASRPRPICATAGRSAGPRISFAKTATNTSPRMAVARAPRSESRKHRSGGGSDSQHRDGHASRAMPPR